MAENNLDDANSKIEKLEGQLLEVKANRSGGSSIAFDDQGQHMLQLCNQLAADAELHAAHVSGCVTETRQALKVMRETCPKFSMLARTSGSASPLKSPGSPSNHGGFPTSPKNARLKSAISY